MEQYDFSVFRERLNKLFNAKGKSQRGFAIEVGIQPPTLNRYLNTDREPDISSVLKICDTYNISLDWMFGRREEMRGVPQETIDLVNAYMVASASDRAIVDALLQKYKNV